jgi:lipid A 3-O-deacylase
VKRLAISCAAIAAALSAAPTEAGEIFGGLYVHDVKLPTDLSGYESGFDVQLGYRGRRIGRTPLQTYVFGALNTTGQTSYASVGVSAKFGKQIYFRPGLGLAIHNGSAAEYYRTDKIAFGSRVLFEPEVAVGAQINGRLSVEASWVHMSHATLFSHENPGIDNLGLRLNLGL